MSGLVARMGLDAPTRTSKRLQRLSREREQEVLDWVHDRGIDQGYFVRPPHKVVLNPSPAASRRCLKMLSARDDLYPRGDELSLGDDDPFASKNFRTSVIEGRDPGYVIVTQRCDLLRGFKVEPFVEIAPAYIEVDTDAIGVAKYKSPRLVYLADAEASGAWLVDLRGRGYIAKDLVPDLAPGVNPIEDDVRLRQFKLRLGQRYARTPVPTDVVSEVQKPLAKLLKKAGNREAAHCFNEFLGEVVEDKVKIIAVIDNDCDRPTGDDAWRAIEMSIEQTGLAGRIHEDSGAIEIRDLQYWYWLTTFKLDLDDLSFGKRTAAAAQPTS